jgi:hypothetical protein
MRSALAIVCSAVALCAAPAAAAEPTPAHVFVSDGTAALAGARVYARDEAGTAVYLGSSDASGALDVRVDPATMLYAEANGRRSALAAVAAAGGSIHLIVAPAVIATISARHNPTGPRLVTDSSAAAVATGDPAAALGTIANFRTRSEGGSGRETLNGVPLELPPAPGSNGGATTSIPSDLIESFSAVQSDDGSVTPNYHVLGPTATPQFHVSAASGRYDGELFKGSFSGTAGRLGYAAVLATGSDEGVLAGRSFVDASGIDYDHSSHAHHTDASLELDYRLGTTQISVVGLASRTKRDDIGLADPGGVPLGLGPGDATRTALATGYVFASQTHGRDAFHFIDARFGGGADDDQSHAVLDGVALGSDSGYRYWGQYDEFGFARQFARESLAFKASATRVTTLDYVDGNQAAATSLQRTLSAAYERGDWTSGFGGSLGAVSHVGALGGTTIEENVHAQRRIAGTALRLTAYHSQAQTIESTYAGLIQWASPVSASFTCGPASATLSGPGNVGSRHPEATTLSVAGDRAFAHGISLSGGAFVSYFTNLLVQPTTQIDPSALPAGYAGALGKIAQTACPGETSLADVFVQNYQTVAHAIGREWFGDAKFPLGPLRAEATYETYSMVATSLPASLAGARTSLIAGSQLPGIPLHRANLILSYGHGPALLAAALQYVSDNNALHLPGHVTTSAGLQLRTASGTLSLSAINLFRAYGGAFATSRYAVALPAPGSAIPVLATPEAATWQLRYTTNFGRRSP